MVRFLGFGVILGFGFFVFCLHQFFAFSKNARSGF